MEFIHRVDLGILLAFNSLARSSRAFDYFAWMVAQNTLIKGGVLIALLWYFWSSPDHRAADRPRVVRILVGACMAIAAGRVLQTLLPERLRPMHDPALPFTLPYGVDTHPHIGWSSFPSDHAVLFFAVATGVWAISRRFGTLAFVWVIVVVGAARVYAGLHYPTDILGGAVLGITVMGLLLHEGAITSRIVDRALALEPRRPALFYSMAFLLCWQTAQLFGETRDIVMTVWRIVRHHIFGLDF